MEYPVHRLAVFSFDNHKPHETKIVPAIREALLTSRHTVIAHSGNCIDEGLHLVNELGMGYRDDVTAIIMPPYKERIELMIGLKNLDCKLPQILLYHDRVGQPIAGDLAFSSLHLLGKMLDETPIVDVSR